MSKWYFIASRKKLYKVVLKKNVFSFIKLRNKMLLNLLFKLKG